MAKLGKRVVDGLLRDGRPRTVFDEELRAFGVRIRGSRAVYMVKYRFKGRQRWLTLGAHGELTPTQARRLAADALREVRHGVDPAVARRAKNEPDGEALTFTKAAERYLKDGSTHLAPSTLEDRRSVLRKDGPLLRRLGRQRLSEIGQRELLEWWSAEVEAGGVARKTGRNWLDTLAAVFAYAVDLEHLESSPVDGLRAVLRRRNRTKASRALSEPSRNIRPIESPDEIHRLLAASAARPWIGEKDRRADQSGDGHLLTLILLDAGLRLGEALGLRWGDVRFGRDASDPKRALVISETLARGRHKGTTKSGRTRTVALSRRLRAALRERHLAVGQPNADQRVLPDADPANYRKRHFLRACTAAKIGARRPKDLRDTYASQLLTAGVQLGYVSQQLGHADVAVTARHYARWAGTDYRAPLQLGAGEIPADLLARLTSAPLRDAVAPSQISS